ncbi:MAG TPA: uroporphyrinogen decarboxylase family protein [Armatimonadota bacterium]|jgi:uroporphyrinogen decarboxylase
MTSRERVLTAICHQEADRVPFNLRPGEELVARLRAEGVAEDFADHFGHDVRYLYLGWPAVPEGVPAAEWTPVPSDAEVAVAAQEVAAFHARGLAVCGQYLMGVYEHAKTWTGDEATMMGPYDDPAGFADLLDRITAWKMATYGAHVRAGVDIVWIGDDLGTQRSLVMSPAQYRQWYRPRHQRLIEHLRGLNPEVRVAFHCCGHVTPLIRDLIEIGVDILEAVQAEAMDIAGLKREFGRDICFWGGVGAQSVLHGSPAQVRAGVAETLRIMAPGGGYIAAPCHTLTDDVPWENVLAFHEAIRDYAAYPQPGI